MKLSIVLFVIAVLAGFIAAQAVTKLRAPMDPLDRRRLADRFNVALWLLLFLGTAAALLASTGK